MPSLVQYLDKHPLQGYSIGPSQIGIPCSGFSDMWVGEYEKGGITMTNGSSRTIISGSNEILSADSLSICFDSGSNVWAAVHKFNNISVFKYVSGTYQSFSFEGKYPQLLNDFIFFTSKDVTHCFYLKSGKIWTRSSNDSFSTETVVVSGATNINRLTAAYRNVTDLTFYRYNLLCLDEYANGVCYVSDLYNSRDDLWMQDFENLADGNVFSLSNWNVEPSFANFLDGSRAKFDSFNDYSDGEILNLSGDNNQLFSGYILNEDSIFYLDSFDAYTDGVHVNTGQNFTLIYG